MKKFYALIVAGGKGLRMGGDTPKQFRLIGGRPVLMRTLDAFHQACPDVRLILVLPSEQIAYWHELCRTYPCPYGVEIVPGGETRFHSVSHGLALVPDDSDTVVAVHDGVRPFVYPDTILRCIEVSCEYGAVIPVTPVVETLRRVDAGGSHTVPRDDYRLVQTPQTFRADILKAAYRQDYCPDFTDDASVVEAMGMSVHLVEGDRDNIKLTTPEDLLLAEALLAVK